MEKEFVPYELAFRMKEFGFDEPCITFFFSDGVAFKGYERPFNYNKLSDNISRPTFSQAFRWFREKHQLHSYIEGAYPWFRYYVNSNDNRYEGHKYLKYEEAELVCLEKLIEIVETDNRWEELRGKGLDEPFKGWD